VPRSTNESDANILPDPELNPLLNPLLAAHMGRWAEVYFTNPPETREQAVAQLIRELESLPPAEPGSIQPVNTHSANAETETAAVPVASYAVEPLHTCGGCGYENSGEQKFCGMCGAPLQASPREQIPHAREGTQIPTASWREPDHFLDGNSGDSTTEPVVSIPAGRVHEDRETEWTPAEDLPHFNVEPEPVPNRYQLYVGTALLILLVLMVYMAWRGTKAISGVAGPQSAASKVIPPAPAPASAPQPGGATPSGSLGNEPGNKPGDQPDVKPEGNSPAPSLASKNQSEATPQKNKTAAQPASRIDSVAASSPALAAEPNGAEELATAENYLNGTQGVTRDKREAAVWLWKAVGKENAAATLALSDLYLRGDGVPKNCEQARVLLDAAARKGVKAAGARLRNLQAFGCQ
jgi:hypothetical protein